MPRMSGLELLAEARDQPLMRGLPIVIVTSSDDEKLRRAALALDAAGYIVKQADRSHIEGMRAWLRGYSSALAWRAEQA
jgi:DNA-binding NarL/FixJ family response regulator